MSKRYPKHRSRRQRFKLFLVVVTAIVICLIAAIILIRHVYDQNLLPVSDSQKTQIVTINSGSSVDQIADLLHKDSLTRTSWALEWYVRTHNLRPDLLAGTYALSPSQSTASIVQTITLGKIATKLVTILPGKRLDQIQSYLINDGFSPSSVSQALQPAQYQGLPIMAFAPAGSDLEGLLYPDSFQKTATTNPDVIIRESLTEMGQKLTPSLQTAFAREGLSTYQGIVLASIVQQEVSNPSDQAQVAQVFLKRLSTDMSLDSDVTAYYGSIIAGQAPSLTYNSPYNTLLHTGLPPTPISTVSMAALEAVASPAPTTWLYFVSGDNGVTYFSQTLQQQQANIAQYCHNLCSQGGQ